MKLLKKGGEFANFEDAAKFMVETYPPDIFTSGHNLIQMRIVQIRDACQKLLYELEEWREDKEVDGE